MTQDEITQLYFDSHDIVNDENGFDCLVFNRYRFAKLAMLVEREACIEQFELYWNDARLQRLYSPREYINEIQTRKGGATC